MFGDYLEGGRGGETLQKPIYGFKNWSINTKEIGVAKVGEAGISVGPVGKA